MRVYLLSHTVFFDGCGSLDRYALLGIMKAELTARQKTAPNLLRRSDRIDIALSVEAIGNDFTRGQPFCQKGETLSVSRHGAAIILNCALATNQELIIRCLSTNEEAHGRVVGLLSGFREEFVYGLAFVSSASNPWGIEFPPLDGCDEPLARILLACPLCSAQKVIHLNEIELQVFEANRTIQQFCNGCSQTTSWKPLADAPVQDVKVSPKTALQPESGPRNTTNRRKYRRVPSNVSACIRQPGLPDETVACENVSRGGISCRASRPYQIGAKIEIAVPFSAGSGNIFVPAHVVYVRESESFFRIGIAYSRGLQGRSDGYNGTPAHGFTKNL